MTNLAPIALFAFKRPVHLQQTLDALAACEEAGASELYIFCDGARHAAEESAVREVVEVARAEKRFLKTVVQISPSNLGLARSIINGVSKIVEEHGRIIVLEDDMVVSNLFLKYMNSGLLHYEHNLQVASICAYMYPIETKGLPEFFFLKGADCWGWATWKRSWIQFEADGSLLLQRIVSGGKSWEFDLDGSYPYLKMLKDQIRGRNNSWAIRWHASTFLNKMMSLYPRDSFLNNIGLDGSGTHCDPTDAFKVQLGAGDREINWPEVIIANSEARHRIIEFNLKMMRMHKRVIRRMNLLVRTVIFFMTNKGTGNGRY
jgi:hypothetical protein